MLDSGAVPWTIVAMAIMLLTDDPDANDDLVSRLRRRSIVTVRRVASDPSGQRSDALDLRESDAATACCEAGGAIVHLAMVPPFLRGARPAVDPRLGADVIDFAARGAYNLFAAARDRGVERIVLGSTLALFDGYAPDLIVSEWWRPRPAATAEHCAVAAAEEVAYQFCLEGGISGVCLRTEAASADPESIDRALDVELGAPGYRWRVFHLADSPRFDTTAARNELGWGAGHE